MDKDAQTDLFPWILGGLLVAVAVPAVLALTKTTPQPTIAALTAVVTPAQPSPTAVAPPPAAMPVAPTVPASIQSAVRPALPAGQVWQCVVNGQKIFSDTACGEGATIRQLSDVNGMDPTPVARAPLYSGYGPYPGYGPNPGYGPSPGYATAPSYAGTQDGSSADDVYSANQVTIIDGRRRHEHVATPRPQNHVAARGRF